LACDFDFGKVFLREVRAIGSHEFISTDIEFLYRYPEAVQYWFHLMRDDGLRCSIRQGFTTPNGLASVVFRE
jgi:hypothetical protein